MSKSDENDYLVLKWISDVLIKVEAPYQIVGGLAARIYGSNRELHDIDLYVPFEFGEKIAQQVSEFITKPLKHRVEEFWDLWYFQLKYRDKKIEIALSTEAKYFSKVEGQWIEQKIDYNSSYSGQYLGIDLLVMPRQSLIEYKLKLAREVDLIDVANIKSIN